MVIEDANPNHIRQILRNAQDDGKDEIPDYYLGDDRWGGFDADRHPAQHDYFLGML